MRFITLGPIFPSQRTNLFFTCTLVVQLLCILVDSQKAAGGEIQGAKRVIYTPLAVGHRTRVGVAVGCSRIRGGKLSRAQVEASF